MEDVLSAVSTDPTSYPLWMLFSIRLLKETGDFRQSLPIYRDQDGRAFAPVFTDKDLALRWVEENPLDTDAEMMPVENLPRLQHLLRLYLSGGVSDVGTDFSSRRLGETERYGQLRSIQSYLEETEDR